MVLAWTLGLGCDVDGRSVQLAARDGGETSTVGSIEPTQGSAGSGSSPDGEGRGDPELPLVGGEMPGSLTARASLGAACQQDTDCAAGNCVDGVCCDSPCTELCAACNVPGSQGACSAVPSDPLCPAASCQGQSSECLPLDDAAAAANCEAVGVCRASAECAAVPAPEGTPCEQDAGVCDGEGACRVPVASELGGACDGEADCRVGVCASNGVCCETACDPACEACGVDGVCQSNGACDAFDCIAPDPPEVFASLPVDDVFLLSTATPPAGRGGTVRDGRYRPIRIDIYGEPGTVFVPTYEFRGRSVQIGFQPFISLAPPSGALPELQFAGTFEAAGTSLQFDLERCDPQFELDVPAMQYTATANGLITIVPQGNATVVITYTPE